jgi:hypothetical protein
MAKQDEKHLAGPFVIQAAQDAGDPGEEILSASRDESCQGCGILLSETANNLGEQFHDSWRFESGE